MFEFKLPDLGEGVHEGEILHWYVSQGDTINEDDPLVEIETDKAAVTIPSPKGGKVVSLAGAVGETVAVGAVMVVIEDSGDGGAEEGKVEGKVEGQSEGKVEGKVEAGQVEAGQVEAAPKAADEVEPSAANKATPALEAADEAEPNAANKATPALEAVPAAPATAPGEPAAGPVPAAPATRRLARELGVELRQVPPSGPAGRVTAEDVRRFAEGGGAGSEPSTAAPSPAAAEPSTAEPAAPSAQEGATIPFFKLDPLPRFEQWGEVEREPMRSIRRKVAYRMTTSMVVVPHVVHMDEADVTELEAFRKQQRSQREGQPGGKLTVLAFAVKAAAALLKARPKFNASIDPFAEEVVYKRFVNVGFAADTERGLVVPVVPDADRKSLIEISAAIEDLAGRARDGKLAVSELSGGTFTITNVGSLGGTNVIPTINYPEVAILGMGRAQQRPVVREGEVVVRTMLPLTLAFDHRIIDGADAARFMSALVRYLSDPSTLLVEC